MSENSDPSVVENVVDSVTEKLHELSASAPSQPEEQPPVPTRYRLFNRQRSLHDIFGGGKPADVLLWRQKYLSGGILLGSTLGWLLFEKFGYTFLTIVGNILLMLMVVLFLWSNAAVFLHRPPPPLPELKLSEEMVASLASVFCAEINKVLAVAHDIALGKDVKLFLKVVAVLWGLSVVGGWFHFITLLYICTVIAHTLPVIYERYEDQIDGYAKVAVEHTQKQYRKLDASVISKLPWVTTKDKKLN
eukprot:c21958_g2_i1 orf=265-1005(+)